jgi:hypothetical protein
MSDPDLMKQNIQKVIRNLMENVMTKVLYKDPFLIEKLREDKPLYAALVPEEIWKGSYFERRFTTPFGKVWETLALVAARASSRVAEQEYRIEGFVKEGRLQRIQETLNHLEHSPKGEAKIRPDWNTELEYILEGSGKDVFTIVQSDIHITDPITQEKFAYELKAPLPNSDQTKVSKEKLLKLYSMEPRQVTSAYFALPYNPYGTKANYKWSPPKRWFNMLEDEVILIGVEFWENLGGTGTYRAFLDAVNEIGQEYKERIYREYLGIEPPSDAFDIQL